MKADALKIPMVKQMCQLGNCLAVTSDRSKLIQEINDRQRLAENGDTSPMIIHAEGGTTNGKMIKF